MNEHVSKLANIWANRRAEDEKLGIVYTFSEQALQQFAVEIVKECVGVVEPTSHHEAWAQSYLGGVDGLDLLYGKAKQVKEHFGVEE
jgi:hypothetical protein